MKELVATNISKNYRRKVVLSGLNLSIKQGEIVGLLGLNGVGKTTLLKILSGTIKSKTGKVMYGDKPIKEVNRLTEIMLVPDEIIIPKHLTISRIEEIFMQENPKYNQEYLKHYIAKLGIEKNVKIKNLSKGNRELAQLGLFLANCPEIVILDEPLAAVDVLKRNTILDLLIDLQSDGVSVVLSTHLIKDIESIMSRVLVLDQGNIVIDVETEIIQTQNMDVQEYIFNEVGGVWED